MLIGLAIQVIPLYLRYFGAAYTAYATFAYYTTAGAGFNVYKTSNFNAATPTWTPAASGIPNVPVDSFAIDPNNSAHLYAGTDIGVYASTDGGAGWAPLGTRLPAVAVFDMAIVQPRTSTEKLRVATYGRSLWEIGLTSNFRGGGFSLVRAIRARLPPLPSP